MVMRTHFHISFICLLLALSLGCTQTQQWSIEDRTSHRYGIFTMDSDGSNIREIYGSDFPMAGAAPSPDGTKIAFFEYSGSLSDMASSEIAVVDADGTGYRRLTNNTWMDFQPVWSPDGGELLFISDGGKSAGTDIYVMDTDGNVLRQLTDTPGLSEADPDWKCWKVVFTRNGTIWMMDEDGSNQQQLTDPPGRGTDVGVQFPLGDYDPSLSPECSRVAFERLTGAGYEVSGVKLGDYDIYIYDIASGTEADMSQNSEADLLPEWSPDGSRIIFVHLSNVADDLYDIFMIDADGTGRTKVTGNDPANFVESGCAWLGDRIVFTAEFYE